jgi:hypothetical protein
VLSVRTFREANRDLREALEARILFDQVPLKPAPRRPLVLQRAALVLD